MPTNYEKDHPDVVSQTVPEAFVSTKTNFGATDDSIARDHYPASESADNLRGTHKLLTFDKTSILTSHPDTSVNEYKLYLFQEAPGVVTLYTRQPSNSTPKGYPGFYNGTTIKTINTILADQTGNFKITGTTDHLTVTASTNEILLDLDAKIIDSLKQLVLDVDKHKAEILKLQGEVQTNTTDIGALKTGVSDNKTEIGNLTTITTNLQNTTNSHTQELATLETTVIKTITSRDATVAVNRSANSVDLSVKTIDPLTVGSLISKDAQNALRTGVDHLLFSPPSGGSTFDPSTLPGVGLIWNNTSRVLDVNLGKTLETVQASQGGIEVKLSASPNNSLSRLPDGLFSAGGSGSSGVSSVDGLTGAITTASSGVATKIVDTTNKQISFGVIDAVTQAKTLYYDINGGDDANPAAGTRYLPLRSLAKCIELVKTTYVSSDVMSIICTNEQTSFSYTGIPGLLVGELGRRINSDSTSIIHEFTDAFWDYIYTNGRTPKSSVSMYESLGNTNLVFAIDAAANQTTSSKNSFSFSFHAQLFTYSPAQTDYVVQVRAMPTLQEKWASIRSLYVRVDMHEIIESFAGGGSPPLSFININCAGFLTDVNHQIDLIFDVNNESLLDLTQGTITRVPFLTIDNYDPSKHTFLNIRIIGSTYGQGSKIWDVTKIDRHLTSYNINTAEFITCSQIVLPTNAIGIQQPPKPITGATRYNISAGLDKPVLEVFSADQWRSVSGGSSGSGNDDIVDSIYLNQQSGSGSNSGLTPQLPVQEYSMAIGKAEAMRNAPTHNQLNYIYVRGTGADTSRDIVGNTSQTNGGLYVSMPQYNISGLISTQLINTAATTRRAINLYEFNQIHNDARWIIGLVATDQANVVQDVFTVHIRANQLEQDSNSSNSFIRVLKDSSTVSGELSPVKKLNIIIEVERAEELCVIAGDKAAEIVNVDASGLQSLDVAVYYKCHTIDSSGVTQSPVKTTPFVLSGTPSSNPVTLSVYVDIKENSSQLYSFDDTVNVRDYSISLQGSLLLSKTVTQKQGLVIPGTLPQPAPVDGNIVMLSDPFIANKKNVQFYDGTQYVQLASQADLDKYRTGIERRDPAVSIDTDIKIDSLHEQYHIPYITWNGLQGNDYQDTSIVDIDDFSTSEARNLSMRPSPVTPTTGSPLARQKRVDEWDFVANPNFYGIAKCLVRSGLTVAFAKTSTSNSDFLEYTVTITDPASTPMSLSDLTSNFWTGSFFELKASTDESQATQKALVGIIRGLGIRQGSAANQFIITFGSPNFGALTGNSFTDFADLNTNLTTGVALYVCPFPSYTPKLHTIFEDGVNNPKGVQQMYYLCAVQSSQFSTKEAVFWVPYSAISNTDNLKPSPDYYNIGVKQMSCGRIPKIIITKLIAAWTGTSSIKMGLLPMPVPSYCYSPSSTVFTRTLMCCAIESHDKWIYFAHSYSTEATSYVYWNDTKQFFGLNSIAREGSTKTIKCGGLLGTFIDDTLLRCRISLAYGSGGTNLVAIIAPGQNVAGRSKLASMWTDGSKQESSVIVDQSLTKMISNFGINGAPFLALRMLGCDGSIANVDITIDGMMYPNSIYRTLKNTHLVDLIADISPPIPPAPIEPTDDQIIKFGNYGSADIGASQIAAVDASGVVIGALTN